MKKLWSWSIFIISLASLNETMAAGRDGAWWLTLTPTEKIFYTQGFLDGALHGSSIATIHCSPEDQLAHSTETLQCSTNAFSDYAVGYNKYYHGADIEEIAIILDSLYTDNNNIKLSTRTLIQYLLYVKKGRANASIFLDRVRQAAQ